MKKIIATAALTSIFVLGGCTKTEYVKDTTPDTTIKKIVQTDPPTTPAPQTLPPAQDGNFSDTQITMFLVGVESLYDGTIFVSDQDLIDTGIMNCSFLRAGASGQDLIDVIYSSTSGDSQSANFLIAISASAITYLCPDQSYKLSE